MAQSESYFKAARQTERSGKNPPLFRRQDYRDVFSHGEVEISGQFNDERNTVDIHFQKRGVAQIALARDRSLNGAGAFLL